MTRQPSRPVVVAVMGVSVLLVAGRGLRYGARELLHRQAEVARRLIGKPLGEMAPRSDRTYKKKKYAGPPVQLLMVGDSIAAGLGADRPKETPGARLATRVAKATRRPVRLRTVAQVGSESSMLADQLARLPSSYRPDVAVIVVGGNDVTHRVPVAVSIGHLEAAIADLQQRGASVVVGTCPDLGALRPVPQPLRALGSRASRHLARAQQQASVRSGAYAVALGRVVGPFFISDPDEMFSLDRFHPSAIGYQRTAKALLPSVLAALGSSRSTLPPGHHPPRSSRAAGGQDGVDGRSGRSGRAPLKLGPTLGQGPSRTRGSTT